jgi:spermidine synthase
VGLGAGEMVCIGEKSWSYDLYEIDPGVIRIASDPAFFPFLKECPTSHRVIQGDGRLKLREAPARSYDQIILDAFTSDSIPTHLLTREALAEYFGKLKPGGVLTLHLSNRYFSLAPVVAAEARSLDLVGAVHVSAARAIGPRKLPVMATLVVNLARETATLAPLREKGWSRLRPVAGLNGWSDDWSNVLGALILPGHEIETGEDLADLRNTLPD